MCSLLNNLSLDFERCDNGNWNKESNENDWKPFASSNGYADCGDDANGVRLTTKAFEYRRALNSALRMM